MSPPRCHFGSSDNGTPVVGSASFSIAPVHRHSIFKPRGAATGPLLALWERCRWPAVILVTASSRWMFCTVHFILHTITSILLLWFIAQLETHNVKWLSVLQPTFALTPIAFSMCAACQKLSLRSLQIYHRCSFLYIYVPAIVRLHWLELCITVFAFGSSTETHLRKLHLRMWMDGRLFGAQTAHHDKGINHLRSHYYSKGHI